MRIAPFITLLLLLVTLGNSVHAEQKLEIKEGMSVFGSSELPKGLTIVPWRAQSPDMTLDKMKHSVLEDIFQPLDRKVFLRELGYYKELFPGEPAGR